MVISSHPENALGSGLPGLLVWEVFARLVAPLWIGSPLEATSLIEMSLGFSGTAALLIHVMTGVLLFPLGYVIAFRPLARSVAPAMPWPLLGLAYGAGLWAFDMVVLVNLLGGMPMFLGFQPIAWASLIGHLGLGLAISFVPRK
jgi:hypothetical protein